MSVQSDKHDASSSGTSKRRTKRFREHDTPLICMVVMSILHKRRVSGHNFGYGHMCIMSHTILDGIGTTSVPQKDGDMTRDVFVESHKLGERNIKANDRMLNGYVQTHVQL